MTEHLVYRLNAKAITAEEFEARLDRVWSRIQDDPAAARRLQNLRIPPDEFRNRPRADCIGLTKTRDGGLSGLETVAASIVSGIAVKLFESFIIPAIMKGLNREDVVLESREKSQGPRHHEPN
jgi:hypothetical protein